MTPLLGLRMLSDGPALAALLSLIEFVLMFCIAVYDIDCGHEGVAGVSISSGSLHPAQSALYLLAWSVVYISFSFSSASVFEMSNL